MNLFEATDPEHFAYEPLVIKRVSKETEEASERLYDHVEQLDKKSSLPGWLGAVQTISLLAAGILTVGIFNGTGEVTLAEGFANAPGIYIGCVIAWLLWAVLFILTKTKAKKTTGSAEFAEVVKTGDDIEEREQEEKGITDDAKENDALMDALIEKNGKMVRNKLFSHMNLPCTMFVQDGALHIAIHGSLIRIPLYELGTGTKAKNATFPDWNKKEAYNSKTYKPFKVRQNNFGVYFSHYYNVPIQDASGDYVLQIPLYDMGPFMELTGVKVEGQE